MGDTVAKYINDTGVTLEIWCDESYDSPRDWDNFGTMIYAHGRYVLGDRTFDTNKYNGWEEALHGEAGKDSDIVALPLYLYDHSGVTMNTTGFNCKWDSGQVGWIYVTKEDIRKELGVKRVTKKVVERVEKILRDEVRVFDAHISGEIYGFSILDENEEMVDSCGGFYSYESHEEMLDEMKGHVEKEFHELFESINF